MGLTAMISFDLTLSESEQEKRDKFYKALENEQKGEPWQPLHIDTTWWKVLGEIVEITEQDIKETVQSVKKSVSDAASKAGITSYKIAIHIGIGKPETYTFLVNPYISRENVERMYDDMRQL